jgi:hypothetical protein
MRKTQSIVVAIVGLAIVAVWATSSVRGDRDINNRIALTSATTSEDNCVVCHQNVDQSLVKLYKSSVHGRIGRACTTCHGGTPTATTKSEAHSGRFVGQPSASQALLICGSCHNNPLSQLRLGRHFSDKQTARVGCVECHGAHSVGSASRNFSFAYYCTGCHGLEYLPHLPEQFQKLLGSLDDLHDLKRNLDSGDQRLSQEAENERRQIRHQIAEIVHPTDLKSGLSKAQELTARLKALIDLVQRDKKSR